MSTETCSSLPSSGNVSFITEDTNIENYKGQKADNKWPCVAPSQLTFDNTTSVPKAQRTLRKRTQKIVRTGSLLGECMASICEKAYTHEVSSTWLPEQDPNKDTTNRHANIKGGHFMRP